MRSQAVNAPAGLPDDRAVIAALRLVDRTVTRTALGAAMLLLAAMACITMWQVVTRFVLDAPSTWSEVAARSLMIWMVYLGLCVTVRSGSLIAIDLLMRSLSGRARQALALVVAGVGLAVLLVMMRYGWEMMERAGRQSIAGLVNPLTGDTVSIAWVYAAVPVGAALSSVALVARLVEELAGEVPTPAPDP